MGPAGWELELGMLNWLQTPSKAQKSAPKKPVIAGIGSRVWSLEGTGRTEGFRGNPKDLRSERHRVDSLAKNRIITDSQLPKGRGLAAFGWSARGGVVNDFVHRSIFSKNVPL